MTNGNTKCLINNFINKFSKYSYPRSEKNQAKTLLQAFNGSVFKDNPTTSEG